MGEGAPLHRQRRHTGPGRRATPPGDDQHPVYPHTAATSSTASRPSCRRLRCHRSDRDFPVAMIKCPGRVEAFVAALARLPKDIRPIGLLYEEPMGEYFGNEMADWTTCIRQAMDDGGWVSGTAPIPHHVPDVAERQHTSQSPLPVSSMQLRHTDRGLCGLLQAGRTRLRSGPKHWTGCC